MTVWVNDDGLVVKFGIDEAVQRNIGAYNKYGPVHELEVLTKFDELPAVADGSTILNDNFILPAGIIIESVEIRVPNSDFDSAGDGVTFNLGIVDAVDRTSNPDVDALVVAATQTELNAGGTNTAGWVGASVGAVLARDSLLTWEQDTAAATAGETVIRVKWSVPPKNSDTLAWAK